MAFKQGNNPLSRKTSPMRTSPFRKEASVSMEDLKKMSAKQDAESKAQALKLPQIEKPGFDYEMDQDMSYPGGERGRDYDEDGLKDLKKDGMSRKESPFNMEGSKADHEKKMGKKIDDHDWGGHTQTEKHHRKPEGMSRKDAAYFGLGEDDGKARKTKKADKTAKQIIKMQNKRSSVKNVYLGDPDDLEGEMVRTADKPAGKREKRKVKKLKKTKEQLGMSRESSPSNASKPEKLVKEEPGAILKVNTPKVNTPKVRKPRKSVGSVTTLKSEKKVDVKTDKKDIDSKLLTKNTPSKKEPQSRAEKRNIATKNKADRARKEASKTNKEGGTIESQARNRAKAKRLDKRSKRQEGRAERKAVRKDKSLSRSDKRGKIIASRENQNK